jgi:hypothetical protein
VEQLTALAIIVSVMAQAVTLFVLHRTIRNQVDRADLDHARRLEIDRNDRLRRSYGNLIKAADYLERAFRDLFAFPKGHDYPGAIMASQVPPDHNRYASVDDLRGRARELSLEAEAVIVLDHEDDPALRIWRDKVFSEYQDFEIDCVLFGPQSDALVRQGRFEAAKKEMEAAARSRFPTLASRRA